MFAKDAVGGYVLRLGLRMGGAPYWGRATCPDDWLRASGFPLVSSWFAEIMPSRAGTL